MQRIIYFTCYLFFVLFINCEATKTNEETKITKQETDTLSFEHIEKSLSEEQEAQVYKIEKKAVIFFMIDRQEANRMVRELGDSYRWETEAMFNGFIEQSKTFGTLIRKHNIKSDLIFNRRFQIILNDSSSVFFDRVKEDQIMGEILSDGEKKPQINFGMYTSRELAKLIQEFFEIENLGYIPPDTIKIPETELDVTDTLDMIEH